MNAQVIYFSRAGQTKKIADVIASELGVDAVDVTNTQLNADGSIFLGSGCYGGKPGKTMIQFIENNVFKGRDVYLFGTSGGGVGKEVEAMEELLEKKDAIIKDKFFCKGKFWFLNRRKPDSKDLEHARKFAKSIME